MLSEHLCECNCGEYTPFASKTDKRRNQVKGQPMRFLPGHNSMVSMTAIRVASIVPDELDELKIRGLRSLGDAEAAKILDERLRFLEKQYKRNFVERGFILLEVEERELWKHLCDTDTGEVYSSFERWVVSAASHSRSDCFESLRAVKQLRDVPREQLLNIPRKNIAVLSQLSPRVRRSPEVIAKAQTATKKEFIGHIQEKHPDQHVEHETKVTTHPTVTQKAVIDEARKVAAWVNGCIGRESCDEAIAAYYLEGDCEKEGFTDYSNRRAYETAKARGEVE